MPSDNLSTILELIRAELDRMGHRISLDEMRRASLPARHEYGTRRIYVEAWPKAQKLDTLGALPDDETRSIAAQLGCSDSYARSLRRLTR